MNRMIKGPPLLLLFIFLTHNLFQQNDPTEDSLLKAIHSARGKQYIESASRLLNHYSVTKPSKIKAVQLFSTLIAAGEKDKAYRECGRACSILGSMYDHFEMKDSTLFY